MASWTSRTYFLLFLVVSARLLIVMSCARRGPLTQYADCGHSLAAVADPTTLASAISWVALAPSAWSGHPHRIPLPLLRRDPDGRPSIGRHEVAVRGALKRDLHDLRVRPVDPREHRPSGRRSAFRPASPR